MRRYLIGRSEHNDIVVPDASVSRQHAELEEIGGGRYALRDLGSTYGMALWRDGQWVEVLEVEVIAESRVRMGGYETTPRELLALARGGGVPVADAPAPSPPPRRPRATTIDDRMPPPASVEPVRKSSAKFWIVSCLAVFVLAALGAAGYRYGPGLWDKYMAPSFADRVHAYCDKRQVTRARCACQIKLLELALSEKEKLVYLDSLDTGRNALASLSEAERNAFARKTTDASQEAGRACPK